MSTGHFQAPDRAKVRGSFMGTGAFKPFRIVKAIIKSKALTPNQAEQARKKSIAIALGPSLLETYQAVNPEFSYHSASNPRRILTVPNTPLEECEHDNSEHNYILHVNDQIIGPRRKFVVQDLLGTGSFGQVVKVIEKGTDELFAIKLVKNLPAYHNQGLVEVSVLERLNEAFDTEQYPLLRLYDHFVFRNHLCLVFELLGVSLFDLLKMNKYHGISLKLVRIFIEQILIALQALDEIGIIHCDLKPENILLEDSNSPAIKVIDFGSACQVNQTVYTYIQSRFYRAPEVLLGLPYGTAIDVWSAGCVCFELFWGLPIFPGQNQHRMLKRIEKAIGPAPSSILDSGKYTSKYYEKIGGVYSLKSDKTYMIEQKTGKIPQFRDYFKGAEILEDMVHSYSYKSSLSKVEKQSEKKERQSLAHLLRCMLKWEPEARWKPAKLLQHPFITNQPLETLLNPPAPTISSSQSSTYSHHSTASAQSRPTTVSQSQQSASQYSPTYASGQSAAPQAAAYYQPSPHSSSYFNSPPPPGFPAPIQVPPPMVATQYGGYHYLSSSAPTALPGIYHYNQQTRLGPYPPPNMAMPPVVAPQMPSQGYGSSPHSAAYQSPPSSFHSPNHFPSSPLQQRAGPPQAFPSPPTASNAFHYSPSQPARNPLNYSNPPLAHPPRAFAPASAPSNNNAFALYLQQQQQLQQQHLQYQQQQQAHQQHLQQQAKLQQQQTLAKSQPLANTQSPPNSRKRGQNSVSKVRVANRRQYLSQKMDMSTPDSEEMTTADDQDADDDMLFDMDSSDRDKSSSVLSSNDSGQGDDDQFDEEDDDDGDQDDEDDDDDDAEVRSDGEDLASSSSSYFASAESTPFEGIDSSNPSSAHLSRQSKSRSSFSTDTPNSSLLRKTSSVRSSNNNSSADNSRAPSQAASTPRQKKLSLSQKNVLGAAPAAAPSTAPTAAQLQSSPAHLPRLPQGSQYPTQFASAPLGSSPHLARQTLGGSTTPLSPRSLKEITEGVATMSIAHHSPTAGFYPIQTAASSAQPILNPYTIAAAQTSYGAYHSPNLYSSPKQGHSYSSSGSDLKLGVSPGTAGQFFPSSPSKAHQMPQGAIYGSPHIYYVPQGSPGGLPVPAEFQMQGQSMSPNNQRRHR